MDPIFLLMIAAMVLMFWFMNRQGKKARERQQAQVSEALVPGAWVQTIARTYHQVVEVNGDVVTLSNPDGSEHLVHRTGIMGPSEPPYELMAAGGAHDALDDEIVDAGHEATDAPGGIEDNRAVEQSDDWYDDGTDRRDDRA